MATKAFKRHWYFAPSVRLKRCIGLLKVEFGAPARRIVYVTFGGTTMPVEQRCYMF
ncbi:hypothetical protein JHK82_016363 [Glycine max]|nr:hypothetical protein JHK87_016308 [Glycine soja]KAG5149482.1 hypothetical protein JHK82_016363 [Glycine max]